MKSTPIRVGATLDPRAVAAMERAAGNAKRLFAPASATTDPLDQAVLASLWRRVVLASLRAGRFGEDAVDEANRVVKAYRAALTPMMVETSR